MWESLFLYLYSAGTGLILPLSESHVCLCQHSQELTRTGRGQIFDPPSKLTKQPVTVSWTLADHTVVLGQRDRTHSIARNKSIMCVSVASLPTSPIEQIWRGPRRCCEGTGFASQLTYYRQLLFANIFLSISVYTHEGYWSVGFFSCSGCLRIMLPK